MTHILRIITFMITYVIGAQQTPIEALFEKKINLEQKKFISIESLSSYHYIKNNALYKKKNNTITTYSNIQLGNIYSANSFNPLKINLFYKDLNTVIILDNRLAEITKIDFNTLKPYKNTSKITTGPDNTIWLFNQDLQQLELYDYKNNTTRAITRPVKDEPLDLKSNYNYCYLLTINYLYVYNYFGILINKYENRGYTKIQECNDNIILQKKNKLYYLSSTNKKITPITTPNFLINQFFVTNKSLYLYNNKSLQEFHLKIK